VHSIWDLHLAANSGTVVTYKQNVRRVFGLFAEAKFLVEAVVQPPFVRDNIWRIEDTVCHIGGSNTEPGSNFGAASILRKRGKVCADL
jgi:hypothetical protein